MQTEIAIHICASLHFDSAIKPLDPKMLFDPFEEQFDLPAATIKLSVGQRKQLEVGGQADQMPIVFGIL